MAQHWIRFHYRDAVGFGTLDHDLIRVHEGNMFSHPVDTGKDILLSDVKVLAPTQPSKILALWNNFGELGKKLGLQVPPEPLYLIKSPNSFLNPGETIRKPAAEGKIVFEGEIGIVIGKTCAGVSEEEASQNIFGYTCANDVTHADILNRDPSFAQWVRAKGFDTFCPFGPVVATGLDPATLRIRTILNGDVRQDYPVSDMLCPPARLVSAISRDLTLFPGDVILCGTSVGVGSMKPGSTVEVDIEGIGRLVNRFE